MTNHTNDNAGAQVGLVEKCAGDHFVRKFLSWVRE